jgi:hypothetical protein
MTAWTWRTWADPIVDFGREVYVPWRLSEGATLYTDVAYFNGPLSPYLNALWFSVFGDSVTTLVGVNLVILAAIAVLLFRILELLSDRLSATAAVFAFLIGPAFHNRNYNFVLPYSAEMAHGVLLLLAGTLLVHRFVVSGGRTRWAFAVGLCAGGTFLTKPEIALSSVAVVFGLGVGVRMLALRRGPASRAALGALGGVVLPVIVAVVALASSIGLRMAVQGLLAGWQMALDPRITSLLFYRRMTGLEDLRWNLITLGLALVGLLLLALPAYALVLIRGRRPHLGSHAPADAGGSSPAWHIAALIGGAAASLALFWLLPFLTLVRAQSVLILALFVIALRRLPGADRQRAPVVALRLGFLALALVLPLKIMLAMGPLHYGFALTLPGAMILIIAALNWIPSAATAAGWHGSLLRFWVLGICIVLAALQAGQISDRLERWTGTVGYGSDQLRTDSIRATALGRAMEVARENLPDDGTLLVLPEGVSINYFLRTPTPTPFLNFMPPEILHYGDERIAREMASSPPDLVLVVHKDLSEYGVGQFGDGYGTALMVWVRDGYEPIEQIGDPPLEESSGFGIQVLRRRPAAGAVDE